MVVGQASAVWHGVERWADTLADLHGRIAHRFAQSDVRERARRYLVGLLERVEGKNAWQLAEAIGEAGRGASNACSAQPPGMPMRCGTTCERTWSTASAIRPAGC